MLNLKWENSFAVVTVVSEGESISLSIDDATTGENFVKSGGIVNKEGALNETGAVLEVLHSTLNEIIEKEDGNILFLSLLPEEMYDFIKENIN